MSAAAVVVDVVQSELEAVARLHGGSLPAKAVVDRARDPSSPLHSMFDWDDTEAAEKWRLQQARQIIARVTVEARPDVVIRAWCSLPADRSAEEPIYRPTLRVMSDDDLRAQLLASVKDDLGRLRHKYASLTELAHVWKAIDAVAS